MYSARWIDDEEFYHELYFFFQFDFKKCGIFIVSLCYRGQGNFRLICCTILKISLASLPFMSVAFFLGLAKRFGYF